ncbi:hypothetical protein PAQ31011_03831 [Pandoraea aquatica]|uniref:DUF4148 domain-containing protein n=1 Tax=Pandoraea aquatica TaxID=2508290 RepID=A0A5E4XDK2_9BURK|nr:DUF4148 domain-containing protein [Pandoraea aquatica]VVE34250.1 hypothetical protein PAQ31011_03831 [Pandoraea aquatica]
MHKRLLLSTAIGMGLLITASVQASARYDNNLPMFESGPSTSRVDVETQRNALHANGVPVASTLKALQSTQSKSTVTRAQVRQELEAALEQGLLDQPDSVYPRLPTN